MPERTKPLLRKPAITPPQTTARNIPPWLQRFQGGFNNFMTGMGGSPSPYLSEEEQAYAQEQQRMSMAAAILGASGPAQKNTQGVLQPFGQAIGAGQAAGQQAFENSLAQRELAQQALPGGLNSPAAVREYEYYQSLTPEQQQQYLLVKRNQPGIQIQEIEKEDGSKQVVLFDPTNGSMFEMTPTGVRSSAQTGRPDTPPGAQPAELDPSAGIVRAPEVEAGAVTAAQTDARTAIERRNAAPAAFNTAKAAVENMRQFKEQAERVRNTRGLGAATGFSGYFQVPGIAQLTGASNANAEIDNLKNRSFANALQAMRDASETGGAVGQVSEREGDRFESMYVTLLNSQTDEAFVANLERLEQIAQEAMERIQAAYETEYGDIETAPRFTDEFEGFEIVR